MSNEYGHNPPGTAHQAGDQPGNNEPSPAAQSPPPLAADRRLLELLVCPLTKTSLAYDAERQELISRAARLAFPIRDGVPLMTVEAARHLDDEIKSG